MMCSVEMRWDSSAALHILAVCVILHSVLLFRSRTKIFCTSHLGVESVMISIPKKTIESKGFG